MLIIWISGITFFAAGHYIAPKNNKKAKAEKLKKVNVDIFTM